MVGWLVDPEGFVKKWPLEYQIVTKTYLPSCLCDSSVGSDISDSSDSSELKKSKFYKTQTPYVTKLKNSKCDKTKKNSKCEKTLNTKYDKTKTKKMLRIKKELKMWIIHKFEMWQTQLKMWQNSKT